MMGVPVETDPDGRHVLSRASVAAAPHIRWNSFVDIVSAGPDTFEQGPRRNAALAFLYESHVQNGGHDAYFEYTGGAYAEETIFGLRHLGDTCRAQVLARALAASRAVSGGGFEQHDNQFGRCTPQLVTHLERHLDTQEALYIRWRDDV